MGGKGILGLILALGIVIATTIMMIGVTGDEPKSDESKMVVATPTPVQTGAVAKPEPTPYYINDQLRKPLDKSVPCEPAKAMYQDSGSIRTVCWVFEIPAGKALILQGISMQGQDGFLYDNGFQKVYKGPAADTVYANHAGATMVEDDEPTVKKTWCLLLEHARQQHVGIPVLVYGPYLNTVRSCP